MAERNGCSQGVVPHAGTWIEIQSPDPTVPPVLVVPHAGTWIEMYLQTNMGLDSFVVPHAGTWIEIHMSCTPENIELSFPTRERGLK